jgi:Flp pilus assembly protein TadD
MRLLLVVFLSIGLPGAAQQCLPFAGDAAAAMSTAKKLDEEAQLRFRQRDFAGAAERYRQITCLFPRAAAAWRGWGVAEAARGNSETAEVKLERARELAPSDESILLALAQARAAAGKFAQARHALDEATAVNPSNPRIPVLLVRVLTAEKADDNPVKEALRNAARHHPRDGRLHAELGGILFAANRHDLALTELLRAKSTGATDPELLLRLATLEDLAGAHEDAIANAALIEATPSTSASTRSAAAAVAGLSLDSLGREAEAIAALKRAVPLHPAAESAWIALVELFEKRQKTEEAAAAATEGLKAVPGSSALARKLGSNLLAAGRPNEAATTLSQWLQSAQAEVEVWAMLGRAYLATADAAKALAALENLEKLDPAYPMLPLMLAQARLALSPADMNRVLEYLAAAEKATPGDPEVFLVRARALSAAGRTKDAAEALRRAVQLRPEDPRLRYQLGQTYQKLGQEEMARQEFERARFLRPEQP